MKTALNLYNCEFGIGFLDITLIAKKEKNKLFLIRANTLCIEGHCHVNENTVYKRGKIVANHIFDKGQVS